LKEGELTCFNAFIIQKECKEDSILNIQDRKDILEQLPGRYFQAIMRLITLLQS